MTTHRALNIALAAVIALLLSTSYLLDGPSEIEAAQASELATQDAIDADAAEARFAQAETLIKHEPSTEMEP